MAEGKAARRLLAFAWDQADRNSWLVINSLRSVCQTFGADPAASATLLRRAIGPDHLARYGYAGMVWITRELRRIATFDPGFVADIYAAMFSREETSTDATDMSGSRILSLTSNKKQDYDHTKWELPGGTSWHPIGKNLSKNMGNKGDLSSYCDILIRNYRSNLDRPVQPV